MHIDRCARRLLFAGMLAVLFLGAGCTKKTPPYEDQMKEHEQHAREIAVQFMQSWQNADYPAMWKCMLPELRASASYDAFAANLAKFRMTSFELRDVTFWSKSNARVQVYRVLESADGRLIDKDVNTLEVERIADTWYVRKP